MSRWLHGTNNRAAAINLSRPLQPTYFWSLGRDAEYVRQITNECDKRNEPSLTNKSDQSNHNAAATCPRSSDASCTVRNYCANDDCGNKTRNEDGKLPNQHGDSCTCPVCRDYNDYTTAVIDPQRERTSTGIWIGNELRTSECSSSDATDTIEYITGIQSGVTV